MLGSFPVGAPIPSQVYKLLTTGRYSATQSETEGFSLKILPGQVGPECPRTKDVGGLPEGPPKALTSPVKACVLAEPPLQASDDRKPVSMLVFVFRWSWDCEEGWSPQVGSGLYSCKKNSRRRSVSTEVVRGDF